MLVLTRRIGQTVMIGDEVAVTILRTKGSQVRIGIAAPKTTPVYCEEIFEPVKSPHIRPVSCQPSRSDE
jgi:carbon storage regulator